MFLGKTIETFFVLFFLMHNALHNKKNIHMKHMK